MGPNTFLRKRTQHNHYISLHNIATYFAFQLSTTKYFPNFLNKNGKATTALPRRPTTALGLVGVRNPSPVTVSSSEN